VRRSVRRLKSGSSKSQLRRRERSELPSIKGLGNAPKLLLDTTVYIDEFQNRLPATVENLLDSASIWHSTVTECELAVLAGLLNPQHSNSRHAIEVVASSLEKRLAHRIVNPDREIWRDAGMLAGLVARLQQYGMADQRRTLNDALIFLSAAKAGLTVLTRNVAGYDLLMQLSPHGQAIFYDRNAN
jgi:predicted nucleic acid-binding protein